MCHYQYEAKLINTKSKWQRIQQYSYVRLLPSFKWVPRSLHGSCITTWALNNIPGAQYTSECMSSGKMQKRVKVASELWINFQNIIWQVNIRNGYCLELPKQLVGRRDKRWCSNIQFRSWSMVYGVVVSSGKKDASIILQVGEKVGMMPTSRYWSTTFYHDTS